MRIIVLVIIECVMHAAAIVNFDICLRNLKILFAVIIYNDIT